MKKTFTLAILLFCSMIIRAELEYQHFSVENGLSQNTVMSIIQDHKGLMWFGTWDGLNKFDGYQFTVYKSHPGDNTRIVNNRIDFLYEDALHYIWFQTYDGRLHRFDPKMETFFTLPMPTHKINNNVNRLNYFVETTPGDIWVDAIDSVVHISGNDHKVEGFDVEGEIHFIVPDQDSSVWIGTEKGLYEIKDGKIKAPELTRFDVTAASASSKGIWFATYEGVLFRKTYDELGFERFTLNNNPRINCIKVVEDRYVIVTTQRQGIFIFDYVQNKLSRYSNENTSVINNNLFRSITADSYGMVWIEGDENGIFMLNPKTQEIHHLTTTPDERYAHNLGSNFIFIEDNHGRVWINPQGGGFGYYDREKKQLVSIPGISNVIHNAFIDNKGTLWAGTYAKGVDRVTHVKSQFTFTELNDEVRVLSITNDGYILAGTKDGNIHLLDDTQEYKQLPIHTIIYSVLENKNGQLWLGTRGDGLILYDPAENRILKQYRRDIDDPNSLSSNDIYDMVADSAGNMYIATYGGGINILKPETENFINPNNDLFDYPMGQCNKVRTLMLDSAGILWIGSTNGLIQMNTADYSFRYNYKETNGNQNISNSDIHCIYKDSEGSIWIGTFGAGLNKVIDNIWSDEPIEVITYDMRNGLPSDIVLSICEDNKGTLWLTSENAITRFDKENKTFQNFNVFKGSSDMYFAESNALKLATGSILFGYNNGICAFNPDRILHSKDVPNIEFTRFQLFNHDVVVGEKNSPLKVSIGEAEEIILQHDQSVFSIEYAAVDFSEANILYAFMLDGFEKDWNYVDNQRKATYTNLPQGTYVFRVKSTNAEGVWVNNEHNIKVIVKPSFWQTPWAILLYMILIALAIWMVFRLVKRYNNLRRNVEVEQKVTDIKLRFFTNISHELRTPLTLISGPVENILSNEHINQSVRDQLEIVKNNSNRMLRMINQILDFRKIQNKKLRLKIQKTNIESLVRQTCSNFNKEAIDKHIHFSIVNNAPGNTIVYIDRDKADIILYNLLSNAFKFTPSGKAIEVSINDHNEYVSVTVKDEGVGIEQSKVSTLFERFTSNNELNNNWNIVGTGIGLNLVKELVDLHHGYIDVKSEPNKGSEFTVMFRKGKDLFSGEVDFIIDDYQASVQHDAKVLDTEKIIENMDHPTLLVVDDSEDMCTFLSEILSDKFSVVTAHDGDEGVSKARELSPILIISDLMMPNKDGLELVNELKQDMNTSHIPIILLTARTAIESRLNAMKFGADDYITKPFSPVYLTARIDNILEQRKRLQESYRQRLMNLNPEVENTASPDERFLAKLMNVMDKNIANSELTIDGLLSEMAMGRTVFYNKLKGLTGFSPVEFIREVRIKRAAQLLETGQYSITEVTYMVGMNDARYFSKCFKAAYNMTPSEYKHSMSKK